MFCKNCGIPTEDGQELCPACAEQIAVQQAEVPVVAESDITNDIQAPVVEPTESEPPVEKKSPHLSKKSLCGIIAGVVLVAVVLAAVFFWGNIQSFFVRTFAAPEDYFAQVGTDALTDVSDEIAAVYGEFMEGLTQESSSTRGEIRVTLGKTILTTLESAVANNGADMDLGWLKDILLTVDTNVDTNRTQIAMGVGLGDKTIAIIDMLMDLDEENLCIGVSPLSDTYIAADMDDLYGPGSGKMMAESANLYRDFAEDAPSEEAIKKMLANYIAIAMKRIDDVKKDKETVEIDGVSQNQTVLTATIKETDVLKIAIDILEAAEDDDTLKQLLDAASDYTNSYNKTIYASYDYEPDEVDCYEAMCDSIPDLIEELEDSMEYADSKSYVEICLYLDNQDNIMGLSMEAIDKENDYKYMPLQWLSVCKGNTTYEEIELDDGNIVMEGTYTEAWDKSTGSYEISAYEEDICTIEFEDCTSEYHAGEPYSGTITLIPSEALLNEMFGDSVPSPLLSLAGGSIALELSMESDGTTESMGIKVKTGTETFVELSVSGTTSDETKINVPEDTIDMTDYEALQSWLENADFDALLEAMKEAGVNSDLVDMLDQVIQYQFG